MEEEIYKMSPEEIEAVNDGIAQIEKGQWISQEEATEKIKALFEKWDEKNKK